MFPPTRTGFPEPSSTLVNKVVVVVLPFVPVTATIGDLDTS